MTDDKLMNHLCFFNKDKTSRTSVISSTAKFQEAINSLHGEFSSLGSPIFTQRMIHKFVQVLKKICLDNTKMLRV